MIAPDVIDEVAADLPHFLTTTEVATLLRCSRRNVYRVIAARRLQTLQDRRGGPLLVPRASILAYIAEMAG